MNVKLQPVRDYLLKIRDTFLEEKIELESEISSDKMLLQENMRFLAILEGSLDASFEAFSPRTLNQYQKDKVSELKMEQKDLIQAIEDHDSDIASVEQKITEIDKVISILSEV